MEAGAPTLLRHAPPARRAAAPDSAQRALRPMPRRGPRKIKASPGRPGVTVSRRRACRIIGGGRPGRRMRREEVQGAPRGGQRGRRAERRRARPRRQGAAHPYMRRPGLRVRRGLVELRPPARRPRNRGGIVGHSAGPGKDARPVKPAFATPSFPIPDIEIFHTDRGSEFNNAEIDLMLEALGIERSLSAKGCPHDSAVDESADGIPRVELARRETFGTTREPRPLRGRGQRDPLQTGSTRGA